MDFLPGELKERKMIAMSKSPYVEVLEGVVLVAFNRATGRVHGTYVHGSLGVPDEPGLKRGGEEFVKKLKARLGGKVELDTIRLPLDEVKDTWIEPVDPATRKPIKSAPSRA
jgi:hypothetical protein